MPLPVKLDTLPPNTSKSDTVKLLVASLTTKVSVAEPPAARLDLSLLTVTVGAVLSAGAVLTAMVTVLLLSDPSALRLPAASENTPLATRTTPLVVLLAVGVNKAV